MPDRDLLNREEGQWAPTIKERFGIPDPREIMAQVDKIVETKLPPL